MINSILAFWTLGPIEIILILIVFGIPVLLIVLVVRYVVRSSKERRRLRMELGKLADELQQVQQQMKGGEKDKPSAESG